MSKTLKDLAVDIYVSFFLKEKKLSYQEKKKIAKIRAIDYVDNKKCSYTKIYQKHEYLEDEDWDEIKKYLEKL